MKTKHLLSDITLYIETVIHRVLHRKNTEQQGPTLSVRKNSVKIRVNPWQK